MVRLVFRPYTQVPRSICTSEPLRASTGVSSGFTLPRHSSPSFGSQHACSHSNRRTSCSDRSQVRPQAPCRHVDCAAGLASQLLARMLDSLVRVSRRVGWRHLPSASVARWSRLRSVPAAPGPACAGLGARQAFPQGRRGVLPSSGGAGAPLPVLYGRRVREHHPAPAPAGLHPHHLMLTRGAAAVRIAAHVSAPLHCRQSLPFQQFHALLTPFSGCFSSFPHGTCSLSVSRPYLALDGVYHPFGAAFPSNPTRRSRLVSARRVPGTGLSPSLMLRSRRLVHAPPAEAGPIAYNSERPRRPDYKFELFLLHSPLLKES